ncbi:MAG: DUF423 domain-containing protein [Flavobacteriales bacterium]|jgi:uncharacterized membrane protein YgdD (TMEM256/DUF423 family)|nr:DUF423 domain-containing protein [Flavobacteriales bacterium]
MSGNRILASGAFLLSIAVLFGAFGAHALKPRLDPSQLASWRTGVEYHFYHALGLLLVASLQDRVGRRAARWVATLLMVGMVLFCGSLYLLSTKDLLGIGNAIALLGPVTPLGGLCFIAGWAVLFISGLRKTDAG